MKNSRLVLKKKHSNGNITNNNPVHWTVLDIPADSFADQWTIMDMKQLKMVTLYDISRCLNWLNLIKRADELSAWVASQIVLESNITKRASIISLMIKIALRFLELNNFNGLMSILQGLKDPSITRLKATRHTLQTVEYRALESWIQFEERLCSDTRYTVLRESIVSQIATHQNVIPWIKLLNKDVNEIERLYSDYVLFEDNVYWNYEKMTLFSTPKNNSGQIPTLNTTIQY